MEASLSDLYRLEERANSSDNSGDNSPSSTTFASSISSPKRSRRGIQKRVVTIPIKDVEGSRFKGAGGDCTPPSDSWAWRKYGQKPIKGSPYPRGYYRCSSSKGCPARKQVERSRSDPNMLVVTYSYEHNHPWPASRNHQQNRHNTAISTTSSARSTTTSTPASAPAAVIPTPIAPTIISTTKIDSNHHQQGQTIMFQHQANNTNIPSRDHVQPAALIAAAAATTTTTDELAWFATDHHHHGMLNELDTSFLTSCDLMSDHHHHHGFDMAKIFPMGEEEESLFADLGELPECSVVFRQAQAAPPGAASGQDQQHQQQHQLTAAPASWCGSTG